MRNLFSGTDAERVGCAGLGMVLTHLQNTAERREDGIAWHSGPELLPRGQRKNWPNGYYNLGSAHGIPGVSYFLSAAAAAGMESERCHRLLDGAMALFGIAM
jgi:lantibiotic biosynthesis protein